MVASIQVKFWEDLGSIYLCDYIVNRWRYMAFALDCLVGSAHIDADMNLAWAFGLKHNLDRWNPRCWFFSYTFYDVQIEESLQFVFSLLQNVNGNVAVRLGNWLYCVVNVKFTFNTFLTCRFLQSDQNIIWGCHGPPGQRTKYVRLPKLFRNWAAYHNCQL